MNTQEILDDLYDRLSYRIKDIANKDDDVSEFRAFYDAGRKAAFECAAEIVMEYIIGECLENHAEWKEKYKHGSV